MTSISLSEARRRLGETVRRVEAGETIEITRRGKPVARMTSAPVPRKRIDIALLQSVTDAMPGRADDAGDLVRRMRDEDRF